jgi:Rrf2 family protein
VYISAKSDYALRAVITLAAEARAMTAEEMARQQDLSVRYLEAILAQLRRASIVSAQRGPHAGYRLQRPPEQLAAADVMRAVDGPLAEVRGLRPEAASYQGSAEHLQDLWVAVRASLRAVLESVTVAQLVSGRLPRAVKRLVDDPDAWRAR